VKRDMSDGHSQGKDGRNQQRPTHVLLSQVAIAEPRWVLSAAKANKKAMALRWTSMIRAAR